LRSLGAVVIDADALAREAVAPGSEGLAAVATEFGADVIGPDGALDRPALARLVFGDPERRARLEAITHPLVARRTAELVAKAAPDAIVVHDVPLIVEKHMGALYHLVLVVDAPEEVRVRRLVASRPMTADDARARIAAQATPQQRRAAADVWIDTDRDRDAVAAEVTALWQQRLLPFEHNVRTRTVVRRPDRVELVVRHEEWEAAGQRLADRVARAAGHLGRGVEHIGSTAVPGLAAKPVIDLQLAVADLPQADQLADALAEAGFPPLGPRHDTVVPDVDSDPRHWEKRLHGGADPAVVVHLHVREHGSPGWRMALLLRDWLRAEPGERAAYAAHKQALAGSGLAASEYAEAKEEWWVPAHLRALAWAAATGWSAG
ncbi:MAG TPA: dephospho-CoA kinase, partial [Angustibacter sp.]|nr:dephospho-CoA kinase [Angustibacter sp.]